MDEGRDSQAPPGSGQPLIAAATRLTPVQEAWGAYVRHTSRHCGRSRETEPCEQAEQLYRAWQDADADARRQLSET